MKKIKIVVLVVFLAMSSQVFAYKDNVAKNILETMYAQTDDLLSVKYERKVDYGGTTVTVKKEIVFVKNGVRYTVWDEEKDVISYNMRVFFHDNSDRTNLAKSGSFLMDARDGKLLMYHTGDDKDYYDLEVGLGNTMITDNAEELVQAHLNNLNEFLGIED